MQSRFDAYDTRILTELQRDARLSMAELGRVITGYRCAVNLAALGYNIRALVRVGRADYPRVVKLVQQTPEVIDAFNVTGEDSWVL
jgi:Lrp/AsnC family transcriptional regulator, leucine-responsive regulatory protein